MLVARLLVSVRESSAPRLSVFRARGIVAAQREKVVAKPVRL